MPPKRRRLKRKKKTPYITMLVMFLVIAGIFLLFTGPDKEEIPEHSLDTLKPVIKPEVLLPPPPKLPKVAIVIDDLGISKKWAKEVFNIESALTLSILPQRRYSAWIAEEGSKRGHDIIIHLPMEPIQPLKLGEGGLYTWMSAWEIIKTMDKDIRSVPYIKGASSHMGSSFTQDKRVMRTVIRELKKRRLFFLDSVTTPKSVGSKLAKKQGLETLTRDIFLDYKDDPAEIKSQWGKLLKIADKRGYAIAIAHPRKNTINFLQKVLPDNKDVLVVPLTELIITR